VRLTSEQATGVAVRAAAVRPALAPAALDRINYLNIGLMLASAALACWLPFEVFLASYAVLGPLHYLTQISWLHDRGFFTTGRSDWIPLALLGLLALEASYGHWLEWHGAAFVALAFGVVVAFVGNPVVKVAALVTCVALAGPVREWFPARVFFGVFLTTVVHVYLFTGLFILAGSMKSRSRSGYASLVVYVACGVGLLLVQPATRYEPSAYAVANLEPFSGLVGAMGGLLPGHAEHPAVVAIGRFLGFAYTYHYLNWFSKTGVIRWHEVSGVRMAAIGVLWLASVALYAYDYAVGLAALFFLSIVHVFLEFPLDARTAVDVVTAGRRTRAPARVTTGTRVVRGRRSANRAAP
jgi:hypothetical protein